MNKIEVLDKAIMDTLIYDNRRDKPGDALKKFLSRNPELHDSIRSLRSSDIKKESGRFLNYYYNVQDNAFRNITQLCMYCGRNIPQYDLYAVKTRDGFTQCWNCQKK